MFTKLKSILTRVIFVILFFVLAKSCVSDYVYGGDEVEIHNLIQMIDEKSTVNADLADQYTTRTIGGVVKLYTFDYSFDLEGKPYSGKISLNELPNANKINLYYLKSNPEIVAFDPYMDLEREQEKGTSITDLLVGILWGLLSILALISLIKTLKKGTLNSPDKKQENKNEGIDSKPQFNQTRESINDDSKKDTIEVNKEDDHNRFMPK